MFTNTFIHKQPGYECVTLENFQYVQVDGFELKDNIMTHGDYGMKNLNDANAANYDFTSNVIVMHPGERTYAWWIQDANFDGAYPGNLKANLIEDVGFGEGYRLLPTSPYKGAASDGDDMGRRW